MTFSPEAELILCCARTCIDARTSERMVALLARGLDWSLLLRVALKHRVVPLVHYHLSRLVGEGVAGHRCAPECIPADVREGMREHYALNLRRNMFLTGQLYTLLDALQEQGVFAVPYKGPMQAAFLYGSLAFSQSVDLDILVAPSDKQTALHILAAQGYEPLPGESLPDLEGQLEFITGRRHHYALYHPGTHIHVDLHWRTQGLQHSRDYMADGLRSLRESSHESELRGRSFPVFSPEELLLLLISHGARHLWERLHWLCDLARLLETRQLDWANIEKRLQQSGSQRQFLVSLLLANTLLGVPIPPTAEALIGADTVARDLAARIQHELFREVEGIASLEGHLLQMLQTDGRRFDSSSDDADSRRVTTVALPLSNQLLSGNLPPRLVDRCNLDTETAEGVRQLRLLIIRKVDVPMRTRHALALRMRERLRDKMRYLWWEFLSPSEKDMDLVQLPRVLRYLYVPLRFSRLAAKHGTKPRRFKEMICRMRQRQ